MDPEPPSLIAFLFIESASVIKLLVLICLLTFSALISGAEVAFFSLSPSDINDPQVSKSDRGNIVVKLLEKPKKLLATILVANNFINIAIVLLFSSLSELFFSGVNGKIFGFIDIRFILEVVVATFLILLFGEILPKIYASRNKTKFALFMAHPLNVLDHLFYPLSMPMRAITIYLQDKLGKKRSNISVDQLSHALELTSEDDTTNEEKKILQGIVSFGNTDTRQVMRPRIDIFALNEEMKFPEVVSLIVDNGYSRIPVFRDNMDNVTGVLYVKDLLPYIDRKVFDWVSLIRDPYFVPENKKLDDLLKEFQEMKSHLAIVVDEYGGTSGLVTLEDIIEEIVGDISDEFDDEDLIYSKLDEKNFVFEGKTTLKDFYRVIRIENESEFEDCKGESETIAGFVLEIAGSFPKKGEKIKFNNYIFEVEALDKKRIKQLKVSLS
ncbi:gliding motility-associated protein GldE [Robertkochia solimangrovi]|uniref:gliding motility-associated protein GldE n=1 Tax=Robertkochia solimangrovi TaxID=2213046 RepID=UPI00117FA376|nr:gliding motility-associated protein GldE [Robertkochia solimangrovi]TRZ45804.1 gliding motility-associated protein GldE [Robertkochia solimangrovi]